MSDKRIVYILRSERDPNRHYTGLTADVAERLRWHNAGQSVHTARDRPWQVIVAIEFLEESTARRFERYLKSGSGRAFARRHFAPGGVHRGVSGRGSGSAPPSATMAAEDMADDGPLPLRR